MIAPVLVLDSGEPWEPCAVETCLEVGACVVDHDGHPTPFTSLDQLNDDATRIDFPTGMVQPEGPPVGYRRVVEGAPLTWVQFWLWWLYNPRAYMGAGEHEGDWEFVQVAYSRHDRGFEDPVAVTAGQHSGGGRRDFWMCELDEDGRPMIYVALGSHAGYFGPVRSAVDQADGAGPVLATVEWREFGPWATWAGRWGNSSRSGKSPQSPGRQLERWKSPHKFHAMARPG